MTIEADPLEWEELNDMETVERVRRFLQVSDASCRRFLKDNDLYIRVGGNIRVPVEGLRQVLFEQDDTEDSKDNVVQFDREVNAQ